MTKDPRAQSLWDELAAAAAEVEAEPAGVDALGRVVLALESAAGAPRWRVDHEPLTVLQRRFGHAQRRLATVTLSVAHLEEHLTALRGATRRAGQPVTADMAHPAVRPVPAPC